MRPHLNTLDALRLFADDRPIPPAKFEALRRLCLIRVRGHGVCARPQITDAGRARLEEAADA